MNRGLAWALVLVMLAMVTGQAVHLRGLQVQPVTEIRLHDSRLVALLQEIRGDDPDTYDSILLNLQRLADAPSQGQAVQSEEVVVAEQLLARLAGRTGAGNSATPAAVQARSARP